MDKYINLISLCFNLSWVSAFTLIQTMRKAYKHFVFTLSLLTALMLAVEFCREIIYLVYHDMPTSPTPIRVWIYGAEHVLLGMVLMEVLHYVEICKKHRKRSRRLD